MRAVYFLCLFIVLTSVNSFAISLQEAIQTSFKKNPITQANDLRLDAARDRARGAKLDMLPSGNLTYSRGISKHNGVRDGVHSSSETDSHGWNIGASVNLFRGGADLNNARAAQKDVEALEVQNNSTNALIPDTKGSLANEIFAVYTSLAYNLEQIAFLKKQKENLNTLFNYIHDENQKNEIKNTLRSNENEMTRVLGNFKRNSMTYEYLVKMPFPMRVDNFEEMARSLMISDSPEESIQIARAKSPDIKVAQAFLESSEYRKKAQLADAFSPRVDLSFNRGQNYVNGDGSSSRNIGNSVYLTVSVPFGASKFAYTAATRKEVEARAKDLDKEYERLAHEIQNYYLKLEGFSDLVDGYRGALQKADSDLEEILKKAQNNEAIDFQYAKSIFENQANQFYQLTDNLNFVVEMKFVIQREIGILFENTHAQATQLN